MSEPWSYTTSRKWIVIRFKFFALFGKTKNLSVSPMEWMKGISQSNDNHQIEIKIIQLYRLWALVWIKSAINSFWWKKYIPKSKLINCDGWRIAIKKKKLYRKIVSWAISDYDSEHGHHIKYFSFSLCVFFFSLVSIDS